MLELITFFGLLIAEPTTAFTDLFLALLCFAFYYNFSFKNSENGNFYWKRFFLFMGISTLVGSFTHAFFKDHQSNSYLSFWLSMQLFSGLALFNAQMATIHSISNSKIPIYSITSKSILLCRVQFICFAISALLFHNFIVVVINSTIGFLMVLFIHLISRSKQGNHAAGWISLGIVISFLTAFVYLFKISINPWFNFKDIAHIIMMISICFIFYGVAQKIGLEEKKQEAINLK